MNDPGLEQAIRAAGGITELARRIGISQPSVSNWERVPAARVVAVEAATGIGRAVLRPDLYAAATARDEVETARSQEYALLATLLAQPPGAMLLGGLARLAGDATPLGAAHRALAAAAGEQPAARIAREYFTLFIGLGRGELLPYGSYYLTGFLYEKPLARLRADLARLGIGRAAGESEPEDHAASLCEIMAGLAAGKFPASPEVERQFFERHLQPWLGRFFVDLEGAQAAAFYRPLGTVGRVFMDIEARAFALLDAAGATGDSNE